MGVLDLVKRVVGIKPANTVSVTPKTTYTELEKVQSVIEGYKKEYSIVGDGLYASVNADEAPEWLLGLLDTLVTRGIRADVQDMNLLRTEIIRAIDQIQIAKNTYTETINIAATIDGIIASRLATLNATVDTNSASILGLQMTSVTPNQAAAIAVDRINAELNGGAIKSQIDAIKTTVAATNYSMASLLDVVTSNYTDTKTGLQGAANSIETLNTYVGVLDSNGDPSGTGLLASVELLQKQNDGVVEYYSGTYDVMNNVSVDDKNPNDDLMLFDAEPYASWLPKEQAGHPSTTMNNPLVNRVYKDTTNGQCYIYTIKGWNIISSAEYNVKKTLLRDLHIGDVFIKYKHIDDVKSYEKSYKFLRTTPDTDDIKSTDANGFTWAIITDNDTQKAYQQALNAYALADDKNRVFTTTPSGPYDVGDMYLVGSNDSEIIGKTVSGIAVDGSNVPVSVLVKAGDMLRALVGRQSGFSLKDWGTANSYTETINDLKDQVNNFINTTYKDSLTNISTQIDKKAESFYQESNPRLEGSNASYAIWVGDLWKKPSDNSEYIYTLKSNGQYGWVASEVPDSLFDLIDTKSSIYTGNITPISTPTNVLLKNDTWVSGENPVDRQYLPKTLYTFNGNTWVNPLKYTDDSSVIKLKNDLADGTIKVDIGAVVVGDKSLSEFLKEEQDKNISVYSSTETPEVYFSGKTPQVNDVYIQNTTATSTSGRKVDVVNTYTYVIDTVKSNAVTTVYKWKQINNNDNLTALADLADGKRTIFNNSVVPTGAVERDMWIPGADVTTGSNKYTKGEVYVYVAGAWTLATKYTADLNIFKNDVTTNIVPSLQNQIDGKMEYFYQSTDPSTAWVTTEVKSVHEGDVWYNINTGLAYYYDKDSTGFKWKLIQDADILAKLVESKSDTEGSTTVLFAYETTDSTNNIGAPGSIITTVNGTVFNVPALVFNPAVTTSTGTITKKLYKFYGSKWVEYPMDAVAPSTTPAVYANGVLTAGVSSGTKTVNGNLVLTFTMKSGSTLVLEKSEQLAEVIGEAGAEAVHVPIEASADLTKLGGGIDKVYLQGTYNNYIISKLSSTVTLTSTVNGKTYVVTIVAGTTTNYDTVVFANGSVPSYLLGTGTIPELNPAETSLSVSTARYELKTFVVSDVSGKKAVDYYIYRYVSGQWLLDTPGGMVTNSKWAIELDGYIKNADGVIGGAGSKLTSTVDTKVQNGVVSSSVNFGYNAETLVNGKYTTSGFGLDVSSSSGSQVVAIAANTSYILGQFASYNNKLYKCTVPHSSPTTSSGITADYVASKWVKVADDINKYSSEFWINAQKLRFTNSVGGIVSPFTIDATDTTNPQITFNGTVDFNGLANKPTIYTPQQVITALNSGNTTRIDGGSILAKSITADKLVASSVKISDGKSVFINKNGMYIEDGNGNLRVAIGYLGIVNGGYKTFAGTWYRKVIGIKITLQAGYYRYGGFFGGYSFEDWFSSHDYYYASVEDIQPLVGKLVSEINPSLTTSRGYSLSDALLFNILTSARNTGGLVQLEPVLDTKDVFVPAAEIAAVKMFNTNGSLVTYNTNPDLRLTMMMGNFGTRDYTMNKSYIVYSMTVTSNDYYSVSPAGSVYE